MQPVADGDFSPFTEREQILRSMQLALGIRFSESDLSKETLDKINGLVDLKIERKKRQAESWRYFRGVNRYWILFVAFLFSGHIFLPFFLTGIVFVGIDAFLYRWIRKRERTTPQASFDAIQLSKTYFADLLSTYKILKTELSAKQIAEPPERKDVFRIDEIVGRAVWIAMDIDYSRTFFRPRKGIVVKIFRKPPATQEALLIEIASPPLTFFPIPKRIKYLIAEYYQEWDSIQYTFNPGYSYVKFYRLKKRGVLRSQSFTRNDVSSIGCGDVSLWPIPSSDEVFLKKQRLS